MCVSVCAGRVKWVYGAELWPLPVHRHREKWGGSARPSLNDMEDGKQRGEDKKEQKKKRSYRSWSAEPEGT